MNEILAVLLVEVIGWLIYTALLWGMIKVQKLNCHLGGLFASSAVAVALLSAAAQPNATISQVSR